MVAAPERAHGAHRRLLVVAACQVSGRETESAEQASIAAALEALRVNRPLRAEEICRAFLAGKPGSVDHLRLLGHALMKQARHPEAEKTLRLAIGLKPDYPHLHEDLGSVLALQQRFEAAVPSFREAIRLEPRLPLVHKKLGQALAALGRGHEADGSFQEFFEQSPGHAAVAMALDHLRAGRREEGIALLRKTLREHPDNVDAMRSLADAYWRDGKNTSDAEALLRQATTIAPAFTAAWAMLGGILHEAGRYPQAVEAHRKVVALEPDNAMGWAGLASALAQAGQTEESIPAFKRSLELSPNAPGTLMGYGHVLKTAGDQPGALRAYRAAIAARPGFGEVYWSMANLKVFRFEPREIAAMQQQLQRADLGDSAHIHFCFALAKAHEDLGDYAAAWKYYQQGNERQRAKVFHDPLMLESTHEDIATVFTRKFLDKHAGAGHPNGAPIFIVGLPRSGSTLVEQILASHTQVEGTEELPVLNRLAASIGRYRADHKHYPQSVLDLRGRDFRAYGQQYLEEAAHYRRTDRPHFTDKLPNNFSHVGLIHLILPNARIINARRHPLDSCLGSYKQLFGLGQHFTYDPMELAMYYRLYHRTMKHWHETLPGKVLDVHYEETVADLEGQVRRILGHCGLPFEEQCLRFNETRRAVRTASSEQVRQPLYGSAVGYWRRYEKQLAAWRDELADIIDELPQTVRNAGLTTSSTAKD